MGSLADTEGSELASETGCSDSGLMFCHGVTYLWCPALSLIHILLDQLKNEGIKLHKIPTK